jgi:protein-tyrosine phosphatase
VRLLVVCLGNICRSPTAEAVLRAMALERGLDVEVDSAGTGAWHAGSAPDPRSTEAAARRGLVLEGRARQVVVEDFEAFDVVLAVDRSTLAELRAVRPAGSRAVVRMLADVDVPDPYYGGPSGFDDVLDLVERASAALLDDLVGGLS